MKKIIYCCIFICFYYANLNATIFTVDEYLQVARNFLTFKNENKQILSIKPIDSNVEETGFLVTLEKGGYIVISTSTEFSPIKAYSFTSNFVTLPAWYKEFLINELKVKKNVNKQQRSKSLSNMHYGLKFLLSYNSSNVKRTSKQYVPDSYLLTTEWNQGVPYNKRLPVISNQNALAGCTQIALAQLMRFHQHPQQGSGVFTHNWNGQQLKSILYRTYNWDIMPDRLDESTDGYIQNEVALLIRDLGIINEADFGVDATSAAVNIEAVINYLGYAIGIKTIKNNDENTFFQVLVNEIDNLRPVLLNFPSHATVADGYASDPTGKKIHINMGWGGHADDYYYLDRTVNAGSYAFSPDLTIYYNIFPCNSESNCSVNLESSDMLNNYNIDGNFDFEYDIDIYEINLKGATSISGNRGFSNQAFYFKLYNSSHDLIAFTDTSIEKNVPADKYYLHILLNGYTYNSNYKNYSVNISTEPVTDNEVNLDHAVVINTDFKDITINNEPYKMLIEVYDSDGDDVSLFVKSSNSEIHTSLDSNILTIQPNIFEGESDITVTAVSNNIEISKMFHVTVYDNPPTINNNFQDIIIKDSYEIVVYAEDYDGDEIVLNVHSSNDNIRAIFDNNKLIITPDTSKAEYSQITVTAISNYQQSSKSFYVIAYNDKIYFGKDFSLYGNFSNRSDFDKYHVILDGSCSIEGDNGYSNLAFFMSVLDNNQNFIVNMDNAYINQNFQSNFYFIGASLEENPGGYGRYFNYESSHSNYEISINCPNANTNIDDLLNLLDTKPVIVNKLENITINNTHEIEIEAMDQDNDDVYISAFSDGNSVSLAVEHNKLIIMPLVAEGVDQVTVQVHSNSDLTNKTQVSEQSFTVTVFDFPPSILNDLEDLMITSETTIQINASDPDGDPIMINADSSTTDINCKMNNNILTITPLLTNCYSTITVKASSGSKETTKSFMVVVSDSKIYYGKDIVINDSFSSQSDYNTHKIVLDGSCSITGYRGYSNQAFYISILNNDLSSYISMRDESIYHSFNQNIYYIGSSLEQNPGGYGNYYTYNSSYANYELTINCPNIETNTIDIINLLDIPFISLKPLQDDPNPTKTKTWTWETNLKSASYRFSIDQLETWEPEGEFKSITQVTINDKNDKWFIHVQAKDNYGHESEVKTAYSIFDNITPTGFITYASTSMTNQDVEVTLTTSEPVTVINNNGSNTKTFTQNGEFIFKFMDEAGNMGKTTAFVDWILDIHDDIPQANSQHITTTEEMPVNITLTGASPNNQLLTYQIVDQPLHGILSQSTPYLTYTPNSQFYGTDAFTFIVNDSFLNSESATVSVTVMRSFDFHLNQGWNLISLPVTPSNTDFSHLFPDYEAAYEYKNGAYHSVNNIIPGKGYWLKIPSQKVYSISGQPFSSWTIDFAEGWHLIGAPHNGVTPDDMSVKVIFRYVNGAYEQAFTLLPGFGYWIKVEE